MDPGDVYLTDFPLPDRRPGVAAGINVLSKLAVVLQGGAAFTYESDVAVVVASSRRRPQPIQPFEVLVGPAEGFHHDSIIDCRWPFTVHQQTLFAGRFMFRLPQPTMTRVRRALVHGLQINA